MAAHEENIPIDKEAETRSRCLMKEYTSKLIIEGAVIPDPFSLNDGWLSETKGTGLQHWPSIYIMEIEDYLKSINNKSDLLCRLRSEYKEGKAYRYFKCDWVKEIFYHPISSSSKFCFLKGRVSPSMRTNNSAYYVWVLVEKDNKESGGKILTGYCSCTAGLLGCCNHVIALLFRVEAAVRIGATKPSSTSLLSKWNVPTGTKSKISHTPIADMVFNKYQYNKSKSSKSKIANANEKYKTFQFSSPQKSTYLQNKKEVRLNLFQKLKDASSDSCFVEIMNGKSQQMNNKNNFQNLPFSLSKSLKKFNIDHSKSKEENITLFTNSLFLSNNDINIIEHNTKNQSSSNAWVEQRKYRLTASNFGRIVKRLENIQKNLNENPNKLLNSLTTNTSFSTYATRHGIATEPHAKIEVTNILKDDNHKLLKSYDSGTIIYDKFPYISASPDLIISCECCGKGLVEIKCPYTIRDAVPNIQNLEQIDKSTLKLNTNHNHYYQIQGQLGISNATHCWYFVYTEHGHYIEKILFDQIFFSKMIEKLSMFWYEFMAPELLYNIKPTLEFTNNTENCSINKNTAENTSSLSSQAINILTENINKRKYQSTSSSKKSSKRSFTPNPIYICSLCKNNIPYIANNFEENSICCEICDMWFHFKCVGITDESKVPEESEPWMCEQCKILFKKH